MARIWPSFVTRDLGDSAENAAELKDSYVDEFYDD